MNTLVELSNRESISDEELSSLDKEDTSIFAEDIRRVKLKLACQTNEKFTPERTVFLLGKVSKGELQTTDLQTNHLDKQTYINWLVKNRIFPIESKLSLELSTFECFEVCQQIISREENLEKIPDFFQKSINELLSVNGEGFITDLAEIVREKTAEKLMDIWHKESKEDYFKTYLADIFVEKAHQITKNQENQWEKIYLVFADDRGGKWLEKSVPQIQIVSFIQKLRGLLEQNPKIAEATAWFQELTVSPLRAKIANKEKAAIANLNNTLTESWKNFISLLDILDGKNPSVKNLQSPQEEIYLHAELNEFLSKNSQIKLPDIKTPLQNFFGTAPQEFINEVNRRGEKLKAEKQNGKQKTEPKPATKNPPIFVVTSDKTAEAKPLIDEICQTICTKMSDAKTRESLANQFFKDTNSRLYSAFPYLPIATRANIVETIYQTNSQEFKKQTTKLFKEGEYNPFSIALWECLLLSANGEKIIAELNNGYLNKTPDLKKELIEIVRRVIKDEKEVWGIAKKADEKASVRAKSDDVEVKPEKGFIEAYFGWLMFWK